jgi:membrane protease YdiL (CAAX protease family)
MRVWLRLPVVVRAVLTGLTLSLVGTGPLAVLLMLNLRLAPSLPWSVLVMSVYLWLYWRYLGGWGWPRTSSETRRLRRRAPPLSRVMWRASLWAGGLAVATSAAVGQFARHFRESGYAFPDLGAASPLTAVSMLVMISLVAGVVEETAYRGYMQTAIERRHGPVAGIGIVALVFTWAHFQTYPGLFGSLALFLVLLAISIGYGLLAHLSGSIVPGLVMHAIGDAVGLLAGWLLKGSLRFPRFSETGADGVFWFDTVALVLLGLLTARAYVSLARVGRAEKPKDKFGESSAESAADRQRLLLDRGHAVDAGQ